MAEILASHWLRAFDPITQKIVTFLHGTKNRPPLFLFLKKWRARIGQLKVWFGQNAGFSLVEGICPYNLENIEFFDRVQKFDWL